MIIRMYYLWTRVGHLINCNNIYLWFKNTTFIEKYNATEVCPHEIISVNINFR